MHEQTLAPSVRPLATFGMALGIALLVACGDKATVSRESPMADQLARSPAPEADGVAGAASRMASPNDAASVKMPSQQLPPPRADSVVPNMIIRNGSVSIEVDSLELAITAVRALATRLGGYVGNVSMSTGEYTVRSATLELKIPSARFDETMNSLSPIGKVEQSESTAQDVGEEFVDLTARMTNARRLEERFVTLLATRTGKLEEVLAVERELARVREEIERYEGRLRFLKSRAAMSTLSVTVHEKAPLVSSNPGTSVIGEAFRNMWRNFVTFIAAIISSMGVIVPVLALIGLGAWLWRRRGRGVAGA